MTESIRILQVDDEPGFADLVATFLEREDDRFTVDKATDAREGLDHLEAAAVDCIVSDYDMPGMNGIEFLATVRDTYPDLPFILYTGKGSEEVASDAISAGVDDYMQKEPGTDQYEVLANRIANLVAQTRAQTSYRELFEKATVGLTVHDPAEGEFIDVNDRYCELLGYSRAEAMDLTLPDITAGVEGYTADRARALLREASEGEVQSFEWLDETKAGDHIWVEVSLRQATIEGRERVLGSVRDITERKQRELELERAERRYAALLENTNDAIAWVEYEGETPIIQDANPAFEALFAPAGEDVVGQDIDEVVATGDRIDEAREISRQVVEGTPMSGELTRDTVDGPRDFLWQAVPIEDPDSGTVEAGFAVYTDITDAKKREREVKRERDRFVTLFEHLPNPVIHGVPEEGDAIIQNVNPAFEQVFGYDAAAAEGEALEDLIVPPDQADTFEAISQQVQAEGNIQTEATRQTADGQRTFQVNVAMAESEIGTPEGYAIYTDITERTEYERELERQNERLNEFAGIVSHDLRNPLEVANGGLELAQTECESDHLSTVADAHDRMERLIEDILTLARGGQTVSELAPVNLRALLESCWKTVGTSTATLVIDTDATIRADRDRLQQLFENLLKNAVAHVGADVTIRVGDLPDGLYLEDDGPGIPEAERSQVFESGYSNADHGTGFGLSIVEEIAAAHGWEIRLTDSDRGGTRFEITGVDEADP